MNWSIKYKYIEQYKHVSCNQYGNRYKRLDSKRVKVVKMSTKYAKDAGELSQLIIMGDQLDIPVRFNFDHSIAYIEIVSAEVI